MPLAFEKLQCRLVQPEASAGEILDLLDSSLQEPTIYRASVKDPDDYNPLSRILSPP